MAVTMADIAQEVGVSQATVSYVLNGRGDKTVSAQTRRLVVEAAERLGYRRNRLARAMVMAQTGTLGAVVLRLVGDWDAHLAEGIEDEAFRQGVSLFLGCTHQDPLRERTLLQRFLEYRVDGVLIQPHLVGGPERYQPLLDEGVHVVFLLVRPTGLSADVVAMDNVKAGYQVGQHLIATGRRHLVYVCPKVANPDSEERYEGLAAAARENGLPPPRVLGAGSQKHDRLERAGYTALCVYLDSGEAVDGVFAFDDYMALGAMRALEERGIKVGAQVGVVGVDDVAAASRAVPALSTVRQPMREIGAEAVRLLLRRTQGEERLPPQRILLEPTLVVRASSAGLEA